ncbi:MAG: hypothetical protein CVU11_16025 [Bacteroidetes bacterium HGW-Bacteroidetes-6]|jgi:hypothetical protein|nr:MAG: hypothetical protein CVU11_16025 [Bacteroidetes bacterium HGW-Bacteroidetes-6]
MRQHLFLNNFKLWERQKWLDKPKMLDFKQVLEKQFICKNEEISTKPKKSLNLVGQKSEKDHNIKFVDDENNDYSLSSFYNNTKP